MADRQRFPWIDGDDSIKPGIFSNFMFAESNAELDRRCVEHFRDDSFLTMMNTHMKTDNNSYLEMANDHDAEIYKKAYEDGYKAGWRRCLLVCNKVWYVESKHKGGSDVKFGGF
jgi:hypothetical protein